MTKSKYSKAIIAGLCISILSVGSAFANTRQYLTYDRGGQNVESKIILEENREIRILMDGNWLNMDVFPIIENSRTLVPVRSIMEEMGAKVEWIPENKAVEILLEDTSITLRIGEDIAKVTRNINGEQMIETFKLDVAAKIFDGRTFVPLRFVAETFGADVLWDEGNRIVHIATNIMDEIIGVERPVDFKIIESDIIFENEDLMNWVFENQENKGIYTFDDGEWKYVLVVAGEKPTGGYELRVESITEVKPGTAYIHAILISPDPDDFVTEALTYPIAMVKFHKGQIENLLWDLTDMNEITIPIEEEIGESLIEMGKAIAFEDILEMKMFTLMEEKIKSFTSEEIKEIITYINSAPTYHGMHIMMLAGNTIRITLKNGGEINLTSYGNVEHVIISGVIDGESIGYCIISPEVGKILLDQ